MPQDMLAMTYPPELEAFRAEVAAFAKASVPAAVAAKVRDNVRLSKQDHLDWQRALHARGWAAPHWPVEHGGTDWSPLQRYLFEEELAAQCAPRQIPFGVAMIGPVLIRFGSDTQKAFYLPRILSGEDWWCQGFSEPGAGSDLASLRTRAVRDGDHYVVDGQKTWTTYAQHADRIFCLVRTDASGKKQDGISLLLIDMDTPGITVRPIMTLDGGAEINEVFFDAVRVPAANRVGEDGKAWTYAKYLLGYERTNLAGIGRSKQQLQRLKAIARAEQADGRPLIADEPFALKIAAVEIELMALETTSLRLLAAAEAEGRDRGLGAEASMLKVRGTEIQQAITELVLEAAGPYALPYQPALLDGGGNEAPIGPAWAATAAPHYFNWRKVSIFGGSNEIQRNVMAKLMLGL